MVNYLLGPDALPTHVAGNNDAQLSTAIQQYTMGLNDKTLRHADTMPPLLSTLGHTPLVSEASQSALIVALVKPIVT